MIRAKRVLLFASMVLLVMMLLIACSDLPDLPTRTPEAETSEDTAEESPETVAAAEEAQTHTEDTEEMPAEAPVRKNRPKFSRFPHACAAGSWRSSQSRRSDRRLGRWRCPGNGYLRL